MFISCIFYRLLTILWTMLLRLLHTPLGLELRTLWLSSVSIHPQERSASIRGLHLTATWHHNIRLVSCLLLISGRFKLHYNIIEVLAFGCVSLNVWRVYSGIAGTHTLLSPLNSINFCINNLEIIVIIGSIFHRRTLILKKKLDKTVWLYWLYYILQLTVRAFDLGTPQLTTNQRASVTVSVFRNNNPPIFVNAIYSTTISRDQGTTNSIYSVTANDADFNSINNVSTLYSYFWRTRLCIATQLCRFISVFY